MADYAVSDLLTYRYADPVGISSLYRENIQDQCTVRDGLSPLIDD